MRSSLAFKLLALTGAAVVVPSVVIAVLLYAMSAQALKNSVAESERHLAQNVAFRVEEDIHQSLALLSAIAGQKGFAQRSTRDIRSTLSTLLNLHPAFSECALVNARGVEQVKLHADHSAAPRITRAGRPELVIPLKTRRAYVGAPFFSRRRLPEMLVSVPFPTREGALIGKVSLGRLWSFLEALRIGEHGYAFVVDSNGKLLAHPAAERVRAHADFSSLAVVQAWQKNPSQPTPLLEFNDEQGRPVIGMAYPIRPLAGAVVVQQPKADVLATLAHMRRESLLWTLVWMAVFSGLAALFLWRILSPLRQLHAGVEAIARGERQVQVDIRSQDELGRLGRAFTRMADALRQLETMRQDLVSMIVHDLKAPLTGMLMSLDRVLSEDLGPVAESQVKMLVTGRKAAERLLAMIQNLLDIARMEEGKMTLFPSVLELRSFLQEQIAPFQTEAESSKKALRVEFEKDLPPIQADAGLLSRVLVNLVSNALRHTRQGMGEIVIRAHRENGGVAIHVQDNGEGIPEEYREKIFEKFVQAERKRAPLRTGTGLGLTFCKMAIEAHGGTISVQSASGQGSTFTVTLPIAPPSPQEGEG